MGTALTLLNSPDFPATDDQLVRALLGFANGRPMILLSQPLVGQALTNYIDRRLAEMSQDTLRADIQNRLQQIAKDRAGYAVNFVEFGIRLLGGMKVQPLIGFSNRGFTVNYYHAFRDEQVALLYALVLMLDVTKPYGAALCRCQFEPCSRFYLARRNPAGGPANRIYCSPLHSKLAHDAGRAERARRHRSLHK
jgi:hypothetical protein